MDNGQRTREQENNGKNNRTMNNGMDNGTMDNETVSAHRTIRDKERDHETMRKRTKSWYMTSTCFSKSQTSTFWRCPRTSR